MSENIKQQRQEVGCSQERLAFKARISRYKLHLAEMGYRMLSQRDLKRVLKALSVIKQKGGDQ